MASRADLETVKVVETDEQADEDPEIEKVVNVPRMGYDLIFSENYEEQVLMPLPQHSTICFARRVAYD